MGWSRISVGFSVEPARLSEDLPSTPRRFATVWAATTGWALWLFASSVYGFIRHTDHQGDDYAHIAYEEFLGTIVVIQLRVVPAYLLVALAFAVLLLPLLHRAPAVVDVARGQGRWRRIRLLTRVAIYGLVLYALSLGPFFSRSPGLLDGMARALAVVSPAADVYAVYRWHLLDIATVGLGLVSAWAAVFYLRLWWSVARAARGVRRAVWVGSLLLVVGSGAWSLRPPPPPPKAADTPLNVLVVAADSLRYDHLGVHGYHRQDISPNIDAFAADAADFTNLHVATASTLESWLSMLSSQFPPNHGVRYMYLRRAQAEAASAKPGLLPRVLGAMGYRTSVVSNWAGNCFKLVDVGFERTLASDTQNFKALLMEATVWTHTIFPLYFTNPVGEFLLPEVTRVTKYVRPEALNAKMVAEIDGASRERRAFFGLLFFSTTHLPYTVSHPFNIKYVDPHYDGPHRFQIDVKVHDLITTGFAPRLPRDTIAHIRDLYDGAVSEFDHYVGQIISELKRRGLYDRTIIIITSDHGEDLYDPGSTLGHGTNFFGGDQSTRIPFIMRIPGVTRPGSKLDLMARNIDIAPTVMSALGGERHPTWQGADLMPVVRGEVADLDLPVFAETCYLFFPKSKALLDLTAAERARLLSSKGARDTLEIDKSFNNNLVLRADLHEDQIETKDRMVRTRRWKLVEIPGRGAPILRLYDMRNDPGQRRDLSGQGLSVMPHLRRLLDAYWRGDGASQRWPLEWEDPARIPPLEALEASVPRKGGAEAIR